MSLQVTGKHIDVGAAYKTYLADKLNLVLEKYIGQHLSAHVRLSKERGRFQTACSIRLRTGLLVEAAGEGADAYASADAALDHLEKRVRRYKRRLTRRHHGVGDGVLDPGTIAADYVVEVPDESGDSPGETGRDHDHPLIVAETGRIIRKLPVSEAVMHLDLTDETFLVFRNCSNGQVNIVYRRSDGHIGWIDPASAPAVEHDGSEPALGSGVRQ